MNFNILTIFPDMISPFLAHGIIRKALASRHINIEPVDIRSFTSDRHHVTDDRPYGGGCGMVMKPEPLADAIRYCREKNPQTRVILMSPQGSLLTQKRALALSRESSLTFVCGRYEGVDERVIETEIDMELSIGDYVLTGGELAAMVVVDAVARLIPGVLGKEASAQFDSFSDGFLEHAQYTRPEVFEGNHVPEILLSGHHAEIEKWRRKSSLIRTLLIRPDLLESHELSKSDKKTLKNVLQRLDQLLTSK